MQLWKNFNSNVRNEIEERLYTDADDYEDHFYVDNKKVWKYITSRCPKKIEGIIVTEEERLKLVNDLFSDFKKGNILYDYLQMCNEQRVLTDTNSLSKRGKLTHHQIVNSLYKPLEYLTDYIVGYKHTEKWLRQRYFDGSEHVDRDGNKSKRQHNQCNYTDILKTETLDEDMNNYSDMEKIEFLFNKGKYIGSTPTDEEAMIKNGLQALTDKAEREVYLLCANGYSKTSIADKLNYTEGELRTIFRHIRKHIDEYHNPPAAPTSKVCSQCKTEKPMSAFGKNSKAKDGKMARCKECVNKIYYEKKLLA